MGVYTRKDGRVAVYYLVNGQKQFEYFGFGPEAMKAAKQRDVEIKFRRRQGVFQASINSEMPFSVLAQEYLDARAIELSDAMLDAVTRTLTVFALPEIGKKTISTISIADWNQIEKNLLARNCGAKTINKYFQYIQKVFSWGIQRGYLVEHPWRNRVPMRVRKQFKIELFTIDEFRKILEHAPDHLKWALEVEYHTAMRPGRTELFNLKWDDVDFETGAVRIYSSKTDSYHTQYVPMEFIERIRQRREWYRAEALRLAKRRGSVYPECPYIVQYHGKRVDSQLAKAWNQAKKDAGISKRIRLYDIRHFYITHALAAGANIMELAARVGHKGPEMIVRVYAHLAEEMTKKSALEIPALFPSTEKGSKKVVKFRLVKKAEQSNSLI
jgi:integrase